MMDTIPTDVLEKALSEFKNSRDEDIERFLQKKAMLYETRKWCSTYVLVSEEALKANKTIKVEGYFTLSNKVLQISDEVSKNRKKKLFNGIKKDDSFMHAILIGQLGKYINESAEENVYGEITGKELLDKAFEIIESVKERIVCTCVLLECRLSDPGESENDKIKREHLHRWYIDCGFSVLQTDENLVQYFKII